MQTPCIKTFLLSNLELDGLEQRNWLSLLDQHDCRRISNARAKRRHEFMLSRVLLRFAVGQMLPDIDARQLNVAEQQEGQPIIPDAIAQGLTFNISHSGDYVAVAVSADCPAGVGIDIERQQPDRLLLEIAAAICSKEELTMLTALGDAPPDLVNRFYHHWTRKEAALKSRGMGIGSVTLSEVVDVGQISSSCAHVWTSRVEDHAMSVAAAREFRLEVADVRLITSAETAALRSFPRQVDPLFTGPVFIPPAAHG